MPVYEYLCDECGGFSAAKPLAQYRDPQPCPACGRIAPRALLTAPAFAGMPAATRRAHATNERASHEPHSSNQHVHTSSCGCGKKSTATQTGANGTKAFPSKRPWMISH